MSVPYDRSCLGEDERDLLSVVLGRRDLRRLDRAAADTADLRRLLRLAVRAVEKLTDRGDATAAMRMAWSAT
jgi:hypothetical protein